MAVLMSGKPIYEKMLNWAREEVKVLQEYGITPSLAIILLNDDPVELETQRKYAELKARDVKKIGGEAHIFELHDLPPERRGREALRLIRELNARDDITGVIIQKPVPPWLDDSALLAVLEPAKDVDGLTPERKKALVAGPLDRSVLPCTPAGIVELLRHYGIEVRGKDVVVVGKGELVGFPLSVLLMRLDATVTVLHALTPQELKLRRVREADIIISAVGRPPELYRDNPWRLTGDMIKEGAVVVGVGGKMGPDKKWYFDVDEASVAGKASAYTPNVGGVGLVTRAKIIENLIRTAWSVAEKAVSPRLVT